MQSLTIAEPSRYRPHLDGLRGIAIISVLLFHASLNNVNPYYFDIFPDKLRTLSLGVKFFFIVSAYTLFFTAFIRNETGTFSGRDFYFRRMVRILPLWWAVCAFYWLVTGRSGSDALASATFAFGFLEYAHKFSISPVAWSLFVEESFYLFFPIFVAFITTTARAALYVAASFVFYQFYQHVLIAGAKQTTFVPLVVGSLSAFALGIFLWFLSNEKKFLQLAERKSVRFALDIGALLSCIGIFLVSRQLATFLLAVIVLAAVTPQTIVRRVCEFRLLTTVGGLCYGIYLLSNISDTYVVYPLQRQVIGKVPGEFEILITFFISTCAAVTAAYLSFTFFEKPIVQWGRRRLDQKKKRH